MMMAQPDHIALVIMIRLQYLEGQVVDGFIKKACGTKWNVVCLSLYSITNNTTD